MTLFEAILHGFSVLYRALVVGTVFVAGGLVWDGYRFKTLRYFYDKGKLNWFGCLMAYLVQVFFFPHWWVCHMIYVTIYWLCHVGRRKE